MAADAAGRQPRDCRVPLTDASCLRGDLVPDEDGVAPRQHRRAPFSPRAGDSDRPRRLTAWGLLTSAPEATARKVGGARMTEQDIGPIDYLTLEFPKAK